MVLGNGGSFMVLGIREGCMVPGIGDSIIPVDDGGCVAPDSRCCVIRGVELVVFD